MTRIATVDAGSTVARPRLDSLTGLRWWAAFGVFLFHMRVFAPVPMLSAIAPYGNYGVAFFFVLSGFVLTWSARKSTTTINFYWRRFARIYPAHLVALLFAIPVFYSFAPDAADWWVKPVSFSALLLSFLLLQGWSSDPTILFSGNPAAWTLTVEAFFYALHPWVNRSISLLRSRGSVVLLLLVFTASVLFRVAVVLWPDSWWALAPLPVTRLSEFVIGMGLAQLLISGAKIHLNPRFAYLAIGGFVAWLVVAQRFAWADPFTQWGRILSSEILVGLFAITILAAAQRDIDGKPAAARRPMLVRLGTWSFAFYLVHATLIYMFVSVLGEQTKSWLNLVWYAPVFAVALLFAWALYRLVEHPVERRMRLWGNRRFTRS